MTTPTDTTRCAHSWHDSSTSGQVFCGHCGERRLAGKEYPEEADTMTADDVLTVIADAEKFLRAAKVGTELSLARAAVAAVYAERDALLRRVAELETERDALRDVERCAMAYYQGWVQDEASDEGVEWTGCSHEQHFAARALRDSLARSKGGAS